MRFANLVVGAALAFIATAAAAQNFPGGPGVTTVEGKCAKLVVGKLDASKDCKGELASVTLPDGTVTFIFSAGGKMLGFEGDGKAIRPASGGNVTLPVHLVASGVGTKMTGQVKAAGFCTFGNPYAGKPMVVDCAAAAKDAAFSGNFRTNGKAPGTK
jgi:hypothetical protein